MIRPPDDALRHMAPVVVDMHTASGLLDELAGGTTLADAEAQVLAYVREHVPEPRKAPLAGSSVYTDRGFIARDMPALDAHLHYRLVDVSTVKELSRRWFPRAYFSRAGRSTAATAPWPTSSTASRSSGTTARRSSSRPRARTATPPARSPPGYGTPGRAAAAAGARPRGRTRPGGRPPVPYTSAAAASRGDLGGCSSAGRAPGCGPGGRGFKSRHSPQRNTHAAVRPFRTHPRPIRPRRNGSGCGAPPPFGAARARIARRIQRWDSARQ